MYYGDELGMTDGFIPVGQEQDPWGKHYPHLNRDKCRTPMQWTSDDGMTFTGPGTTPWLPFSDTSTTVASQIDDSDSMLTLYRTLLDLRHREPALTLGSIRLLGAAEAQVLAYERAFDGTSILIAINFTGAEQLHEFPRDVRQILSTHKERSGLSSSIMLGPNEAVVVR
jgi:alpha-glucosidase